MVLVASSRSARTALPREQNHPGRRFAQAAQPKGDDRPKCLGRLCSSNVNCVSAIVFIFRSLSMRPALPPFPSPACLFAQVAAEALDACQSQGIQASSLSLPEPVGLWM